MPPKYTTKLDLASTDPTGYFNNFTGPLPEDEFLTQQLGNDYWEYLKMRRDAHVRAQLQKRRQAILGRRVLAETRSKKAKDKVGVDRATDILDRINYESLCSKLLNSGQLIGFSVLRLDFDQQDTLLIPRVQFVPQNRFSFQFPEPEKTDIPVATGEKLDPKTDIILVDGYELRLLTKANPLKGERCPKGRFICYTFDADNSPWGLGLGYSIYPWWLVKREALRAWTMHGDRYGSPPLIGTHPDNMNPKNQEHKEILRDFENFLESVSPHGWAKLPQGFDAKVLDGIGQAGPDVLASLINMADAQISKVILGEVQYSDKLSGSYAANNSQVEDRESGLTDADVNILDEHIDRDLWTETQRLNYPNNDKVIVRRETIADRREQERKQQEKSELLQTVQKDVQLITGLGLEPSDEYIRETYGPEWTKKAPPTPPAEVNPGETPPNTVQELLQRQQPASEENPPDAKFASFAEVDPSSTMLAFWLPADIAKELAISPEELPDAEPADDLHLTLGYFGKLRSIPNFEQWLASIKKLCDRTPPMQAAINGIGRFGASESSDSKDVLIALVDVPGLTEFRQELIALSADLGLEAKANHGFTPHITLAYVNPGTPYTPPVPSLEVEINRIALTIGTSQHSFALLGESEFSEGLQFGFSNDPGFDFDEYNRDWYGRFAKKDSSGFGALDTSGAAVQASKELSQEPSPQSQATFAKIVESLGGSHDAPFSGTIRTDITDADEINALTLDYYKAVKDHRHTATVTASQRRDGGYSVRVVAGEVKETKKPEPKKVEETKPELKKLDPLETVEPPKLESKKLDPLETPKGKSPTESTKSTKPAPTVTTVSPAAGPAVSKSVMRDTTAKGEKAIDEANSAIDEVHSLGSSKFSVNVRQDNSMPREVGGKYMEGRKAITLNADAHPAEKAFFYVHEMGHAIDGQILGKGADATMLQVAIQQTKAYKALAAARKEAKGRQWQEHFDYLLQPDELLARGYSQWIAARSSNPLVKEGLNRFREKTSVPMQWDDDDFEPLAKAFDRMFRKKGLIK